MTIFKFRRRGASLLILAYSLVLGAGAALAADRYIAPNGDNSNSGSSSAPWETFQFAWGKLAAGDTLIVKNGEYFEDLTPPSGKQGTASAPITIRAENNWQAIIRGDNSDQWSAVLGLGSGNRYLVFEGLKIITDTSGSEGVNFSSADDCVLRRMSVWCKYEPSDPWAAEGCISFGGSASNNLIEDTWIYDKSRYTILVYSGPTANVFRRVVVRHGDYQRTETENPQAGIVLYAASGNTVENLISMDNFLRSDSENSGIYLTAHPGQSASNNKLLGTITLNNHASPKKSGDDGGSSLPAMGIHLDCDTEDLCADNLIENSVSWDNDSIGFNVHNSQGAILGHVTLGDSSKGIGNNSSDVVLENSLIYDNDGSGITGSYSTEDYNNVFGNGSNGKSGSHDLSQDPELSYILRIEPGSNGSGKGEGGSDMGANVVKRYENGVLTSENLWPWPNEEQIRQDLCAPTGPFTDGWCATQKTLTEYLWEYRGNPCPAEICNGGSSATVPLPPLGLAATASSSTTIELSWVDASDDETGFAIQRSTAFGGPFSQVGTAAADATDFVDSELSADTTYYYRVAAFNDAGNSVYSNVSSATTDIDVPDTRTNLMALPLSSSQITICWMDANQSENGFLIERWTPSDPESSWQAISTNPANKTCYMDNGLQPSTEFQYRVTVYGEEGNSGVSNIASATTFDAAPLAPVQLTATALSTHLIRLSWIDQSDNESAFAIERADSPDAWKLIAVTDADTATYVDTGLNAFTTYEYRVRSYNSSGQGVSNVAGATTVTGNLVPSAPWLWAAQQGSGDQVDLFWADTSLNESGFVIERAVAVGSNSIPGEFTAIATVGAGVVHYVDEGLLADEVFYYRIRAYNTVGQSAYSSTVAVSSPPGVPLPPVALLAIAGGSSTVTLFWTDLSDNESGFVIERKKGITGIYNSVATLSPDTVLFEDGNLAPSTQYYYRVRAFNDSGDSEFSHESGVTTSPL